jgi:hypothetical protein
MDIIPSPLIETGESDAVPLRFQAHPPTRA